MADTKLSDLSSGAPAAATDIIYAVKDPSGTPADAKLTLANVKDYIIGLANTWTQNQTFSGGVNKVTITAPATGSTLTIANGKTLTANNTLTLAGTDSTTMTFPSTSGTVATLNTANTFTANQTFTTQTTLPLQTLTDGANINWNCNNGAKAKVTLGGNRTINAVTNAVEGTSYTLWVIQDGTGGRTVTWASSGAGSYDFGVDGAPVLTTAINQADVLGFEAISIGGTLKLRFVGIKKGFA